MSEKNIMNVNEFRTTKNFRILNLYCGIISAFLISIDGIAHLGMYFILFIYFPVYILFLILEIRCLFLKKMNLIEYYKTSLLAILGFLFPFLVILIARLISYIWISIFYLTESNRKTLWIITYTWNKNSVGLFSTFTEFSVLRNCSLKRNWITERGMNYSLSNSEKQRNGNTVYKKLLD